MRLGRKGEPAHVALDGRRRRLGLLLLREPGAVDDDYLVDCLLAETPAQQAAAIVLPNTEHAPVHIADVIVAIGKLRKAKMDTRAISAVRGRRSVAGEDGAAALQRRRGLRSSASLSAALEPCGDLGGERDRRQLAVAQLDDFSLGVSRHA